MTALGKLVRDRMRELDITSFDQAARLSETFDDRKGSGLDPDTIRRIAAGERTAIQERTLTLLAAVLRLPPTTLRAAASDRSRDQIPEFRTPPEAHHVLMTARVHKAVQELIRSTAEALAGAYAQGYQDGMSSSDPVQVAEALGSVDTVPTA